MIICWILSGKQNNDNKKIVVGGCYPSAQPEEVIAAGADVVVQGEAEGIMPQVQAALEIMEKLG